MSFMISAAETIYYEFDNFRLDVENQQLLKDGRAISLTNKAFLTLLILVRNSGQIVEKEDLMSELWTDSFVEESNLSQYIYTLRKVLGKNAADNPYIETITKRGFRFSAHVEKFPPAADTVNKFIAPDVLVAGGNGSKRDFAKTDENNTKTVSPTNGSTADASPGHHTQIVVDNEQFADAASKAEEEKEFTHPPSNSLPQVSVRRTSIMVIGLLLVVGISFLSVWFFRDRTGVVQTQPVTSSSGIKSIAVLPFKTIGDTDVNDKLGFGMADAVITRLSKLKRIPVRSTSAVFAFFDQPEVDALKAGRELGVDSVLEGTVQREGSRVRVSMQLTNTADGKSLWAEKFDGSAEDIFALQDSISAKVAESLELNLTREQEKLLAERATTKPEAFQAYQTGLYFWNKRNKDSLEKAVEHFQQAINADPRYPQAYAGLADSYNMLGYYKFADEKEMLARAREAAEKALSLDDNLAEAHMAMAYVQQFGPRENLTYSARSLERAIELSPYNPTVRVRYAWLLLALGNLEGSVLQARLAQEYDPLSHVSNNVVCGFLSFQHKYDEAIPFCEKAVTITPNAPRNRLVLAKVYFFNGRKEDAFAQLQTQIYNATAGIDRDEALGLAAYFYAKIGQTAEAEKILATLKSKVEVEPSLYNYLSLISFTLGKKEEALRYHKKAIELKQISVDTLRFRYDPVWEDMRADKRFSVSDVVI